MPLCSCSQCLTVVKVKIITASHLVSEGQEGTSLESRVNAFLAPMKEADFRGVQIAAIRGDNAEDKFVATVFYCGK